MTIARPILLSLVTLATLALLSACGTGGVTEPSEDASITVKNARPDSSAGWLYFSLDGDSAVAPERADTDEWDIRMAYLQCCGNTRQIDIHLNSGNAGVGSTQGIAYKSRYENMTRIPTGVELRDEDTTIGNRIVTIQVLGDEAIFVYQGRPHHTLQPNANRVLLIRTRNQNVYKFQFTSVYKDAEPSPTQETPIGYYHFRYQQATNGEW